MPSCRPFSLPDSGWTVSGFPNKIRVALADDHPVFRDSLRKLLSAEDDLEVVAEAEDGDEVVAMLEEHSPDVLLLDLSMPHMDGLSVLRRIRSQGLGTKVIVLTVSEDEAVHVSAMRCGASGIVMKNKATEFLMQGIRKVHEGEICLDEKTMLLVMRQFSSPGDPPAKLSRRELEILNLVCEGLKNREIAEKLYISADTVKSHLSNIYEKTGVADRMHLVLYAIESGLAPGQRV